MIDLALVNVSRLQFALTALYHFLFVPLTLGLSMILVIMEAVYVMTGREIWKRMTRFWGMLFGINFAMGVATGITMEFQFGTNWAYYSHYVGDIFGAPLALEGLMAFFLEATFVGLFFFGWERLSRVGHLAVTALVALGSSLSALWILIANAWMQHPVGAQFNPQTMRMELLSFSQVLFNPVAQAKFVHTVAAGYVVGSVFVLAVSAWYLLRGRNVDIAKRSMAVAASFGLACALSVAVLGDESGYLASDNQKMKIAAIEAEWRTEAPPAGFTVFGFPDVQARTTHAELKVPWVPTSGQIEEAAWSTVPNVPVLFWSFRVMVGLGLFFILLFATAFYLSARHRFEQNRWFLRIAFLSLPLPWIAAELGWIVAEYGRQPWSIDGLLPTFLGVSVTPVTNVWLSLAGFVIFYSALAVVDVYLLVRMIRGGPDGLGYWPPERAGVP
ncbi:MAG: cytochrome ubiquinol oxidase subunit I [Gammaproteobacteria bacterium]|nr:MAG: cytochrome ubiquinol oxidase subunit I [Gammaproteobacteria bacterium]